MAHLQHVGNIRHRHVFAVSSTDGFVPLFAQLLGFGLQLALTHGMGFREGFEFGLRFWGFSFRTSDLKIVGTIPASRLA